MHRTHAVPHEKVRHCAILSVRVFGSAAGGRGEWEVRLSRRRPGGRRRRSERRPVLGSVTLLPLELRDRQHFALGGRVHFHVGRLERCW
jgi:hypothetical protein